MVRSLDKKLMRDIYYLRGQVITIALVVAVGIGSLIGAVSTRESLRQAQANFYVSHHYAQLFSHLKRAPTYITDRIARLPGVKQFETRIVKEVTLDMPDMDEPAVGRFISIPDSGHPKLNRLIIIKGRALHRGKLHELLVSEAFAKAHALKPGDSISAILNGRKQKFTIAGIAISPEYVYAIRPADMLPNDRSFGIFWGLDEAFSSAFGMKNSFNDIVLSLNDQTEAKAVMKSLDEMLEPYGSLGATTREEQISHRFVSDEIRQLRFLATVIPGIFLLVATFLLSIVTSRLITLQRSHIATLKAIGYRNRTIGMYYLKLVTLIVLIGSVIGLAFGAWMGSSMTNLYRDYFHFPNFKYILPYELPLVGLAITWLATLSGTVSAVYRVVKLPPSIAMRPATPVFYSQTFLERFNLTNYLSPMLRMVVRYLIRRPLRTLLTAVGIACAVAIMVLGMFWGDAIDFIISTQFNLSERQHAIVTFNEAVEARMLHDIEGLPGVMAVEGFRIIPVRIRASHRAYETAIFAYPRDVSMRLLLNTRLQNIELHPKRLYLSRGLSDRLRIQAGDTITIETLEGKRVKTQMQVSQFVDDFIGLPAYMELNTANRMLKEDNLISSANIIFDSHQQSAFYQALKESPKVATVQIRRSMIRIFEDTFAKHIMVFTGFLLMFASIIAIGIVYNNARITLSERTWELASLRVLGFTRGEVARLLLDGLAIEIFMGIPLGYAFGYLLATVTISMIPNEIFRIPLHISWFTYTFATLVTIFAGIISAIIVRKKINHLDLTAVLRTLE